jgi:hypothetical protein
LQLIIFCGKVHLHWRRETVMFVNATSSDCLGTLGNKTTN